MELRGRECYIERRLRRHPNLSATPQYKSLLRNDLHQWRLVDSIRRMSISESTQWGPHQCTRCTHSLMIVWICLRTHSYVVTHLQMPGAMFLDNRSLPYLETFVFPCYNMSFTAVNNKLFVCHNIFCLWVYTSGTERAWMLYRATFTTSSESFSNASV